VEVRQARLFQRRGGGQNRARRVAESRHHP
jgi:hypothetical protein